VDGLIGASDNQRHIEDGVGFLRGRTGPATSLIVRFISEHQGRRGAGGLRWGVESICAGLCELGVQIAPSTYYEHVGRPPSRREIRDAGLKPVIERVHADNYGVYGARKVWLALRREGIEVARCTVERLMTELGLTGAVRGVVKRTTIADPVAARPADLVQRKFAPPAPNRLWVADLTYVSTWSGFAYVAFVVDAYARRILGWRVASTMTTAMVLDGIEQAIWTRQREGVFDLNDVVHHTDRGSQYTSIRFTERLAEAGIQPSVGAAGSSYDNALAETINGLYKTELIKPRKPWRTIEEVELATAQWVHWFNHRRLYEYCGDIPPVELETAYYAQHQRPAAG
jgi:putative transposase